MARNPPSGPHVVEGRLTEAVLDWIRDGQLTSETNIGSINSGVTALAEAVVDSEANAQAQIAQANAAAQAAIAATGSTETDQDYASVSIAGAAFNTILTNNLNHAGSGNYNISAGLFVSIITSASILSSGTSLTGEWQIIENPGANVLFAGGAFTITSNPGEGGGSFYENSISFAVALPDEDAVADAGSGAVTIELQVRRTAGATTATDVAASLLTEWA